MKNKVAVVLGVADRDSLAWSIAIALHQQGAKVFIGYQHQFYSRVRLLLEEYPEIRGQRCDVLKVEELQSFFSLFQETGIDVLVHSIAYGPMTAFTQQPSDVSSVDFSETLEISTHSLAKVVHFAKPFLNPWGSVMTLTFQASERAMPFYGMMGVAKAALESLVRYLAIELGARKIRVNAISAGPIETLAALSEIVYFRKNPELLKKQPPGVLSEVILSQNESVLESPDAELQNAKEIWKKVQAEFARKSAIQEILNAEDIAQTAVFLAGNFSRKITGQVVFVDCGYSTSQLV